MSMKKEKRNGSAIDSEDVVETESRSQSQLTELALRPLKVNAAKVLLKHYTLPRSLYRSLPSRRW